MTTEAELKDKLRKIKALFAGAAKIIPRWSKFNIVINSNPRHSSTAEQTDEVVEPTLPLGAKRVTMPLHQATSPSAAASKSN